MLHQARGWSAMTLFHPKSAYDEIRGIVEDALSTAEPRLINDSNDSVVLDPEHPAVSRAVPDEPGGQIAIGTNVQRDA